MKKQIITTALAVFAAGFASAGQAEGDYTVTMDFVANPSLTGTTTTVGSVYKPNVGTPTDNWASYDFVTGIKLDGGYSYAQGNPAGTPALTDYTKDILLVAANIGLNANKNNGVSYDNYVTYSLTFTAVCDSKLDSVKLALISFNGQGKNHGSTVDVDYKYTVGTVGSADWSKLELHTTTDSNQNYNSAPVFDLGAGTITKGSGGFLTLDNLNLDLKAGQEYTISVDLRKNGDNTTDGFFVGLGGVQMKGVIPEPATATLSLLALAGLASRRRRK